MRNRQWNHLSGKSRPQKSVGLVASSAYGVRRFRVLSSVIVAALVAVLISTNGLSGADDESAVVRRKRAETELKNGNWKDALADFRVLAVDPETDARLISADLRKAVQCLGQLGQYAQFDALVEESIDAHGENWRLLRSAAQLYRDSNHHGMIIAGEYDRGGRSGKGRHANSIARDRVRAMQLFEQARLLAKDDEDTESVSMLMTDYAYTLLYGVGYLNSWQLQTLTDLETLPDYENSYWWNQRGGGSGAPVDADGNPLFHRIPLTFDGAKSNGERWRWLLAEAERLQPGRRTELRLQYANFLWQQFGVQSLAQFSWWRGGGMEHDAPDDEGGTYSMHTLSEKETIARLATGVKRFELPDEHNFIRMFRELFVEKNSSGRQSSESLCSIFENRRQYPKAAAQWREAIRVHGDNAHRTQRLKQIVGNWGRFENTRVQAANAGASVDFRFRNGDSVEFAAHPIDTELLIADVKALLKSKPDGRNVNWRKFNLSNLGYRIVTANEKKYVGERVANWSVDLKPRPEHIDDRITVRTPLQKAGAYLVSAKMKDGNTSRIVLWVEDTAIAKKQLDNKMLYYVADAVDGHPIAGANVEFFGWRTRSVPQGKNKASKLVIDTRNFAEFTNADGQIVLDPKQTDKNFQWLAVARTKQGRMAYLGFDRIWFHARHDAEYHQHKVYTVTDRPVYRPGQKVQFKFWLRNSKYDKEDTSEYAGNTVNVIAGNPKGEQVFAKSVKLDEYGGAAGEFELEENAQLGQWSLHLQGWGGGKFRVEEYKKPEFEVLIEAPTKPVQLGEKVTAKINAKYYFGAPVTQAKVKYKVLRTSYDGRWFPVDRWDWFYGSGYWWFGYDYPWYPGWAKWGCRAPIFWWWPQVNQPPEIVSEAEVEIGEDGTLSVEIDTLLAKEMHGDSDHRYEITAEVVDQSRRTIVGRGEVLVARQPFKVFSWVDRGHYRTGDNVTAEFQAHTLDKQPVQGKGRLSLKQISYEFRGRTDGVPQEKTVQEWDLDTNAEGRARQQFKAAGPGQYRLSYELTDDAGHSIEGGYVFTITGDEFTGRGFRFNDLELIPDKRSYKAGESVRLMVNTSRRDSTVLLFLRPANGVYLPPKVLRLDGNSSVQEIGVVKRDMPNFFIEALTIANAQVHTEMREVVVPPEKRILNIDIEPSSEEYKPGEEATVQIRLTDHDGEPFVGSTVVSVYDRSVEYISGGSNVPEIHEFFWKWRRHHQPMTLSTLARVTANLLSPGDLAMSNLGVFGHSVVEEFAKDAVRKESEGRSVLRQAAGKAQAVALSSSMAEADDVAAKSDGYAAPGGGFGNAAGNNLVQPKVRSNFADTAFWSASLTTDENGLAVVKFLMPENLTGWKIRAWGMGHGTRVGEGTSEVVTVKNLLVRMQAPRFFVEKDEVVLSANVHNYLDEEKETKVEVILEGGTLVPAQPRSIPVGATDADVEAAKGFTIARTVRIPAGGEVRVDWRVKVVAEGEASVTMRALTDEESDAMQMKFPCFVHGMLKTESFSGVVRLDEKSQSIKLNVPQERRPEQSRLELRYSPTLAGAMVDALPYLVEYPYGCTEQTLNRFIPTVVTQRILQKMNLDLADIREKRTNLNAQEIGDDRERARRWTPFDTNPVFDETEVKRMVKSGVERLTSMQIADGGWGWFSGWGEQSYPHTTAVVVHGLQVATQNDVAIVPGTLRRGVEWLKRHQDTQLKLRKNFELQPKKHPWKSSMNNLDAFIFLVLNDAGIVDKDVRSYLYKDRNSLSVYGKCLLGLTLHAQKQDEQLAMILRNIEQFVVQDDENQTAYLDLRGNNSWWYWWGSDIEANAWYLKLLARTNPKGDRAAGLVKFLLNNRRHGTYWRSTRDTAYCIEAMADYLKASGEDRPDMTIEVLVDGEVRKSVKVDAKNLFSFDNKLVLEGEDVTSGAHTVEVRRTGTGPVYFNAYLTNFTLEDFITKTGLEVKVARKYFRLNRVDKTDVVAGSRGQVVSQKEEKYEREALKDLSTVKSGDLIEVELEIESKNDYEYLVFEDPKAAGFEPVEVRSGYNGNEMGAYVEYRDEKVALFVRLLPRGRHSVSYRLRAEIPGRFSALPTRASAMYAPELKANSDEIRLLIED